MFLLVVVHAAADPVEFKTLASSERSASPIVQFLAPLTKRSGAHAYSFITIGRAPNNDIVIEAGSVSKSHAFIAVEGDRLSIADAGSSHGTIVNGEKLEPRRLVPIEAGTVIQFSPHASAKVVDADYAEQWRRAHHAR